jgi:hypothetical protein
MAKSLVDYVDFLYKESQIFKDAVTAQIWTLNYWATGKKLVDALNKTNAGKILIESLTGACDFKDDGKIYFDTGFAVIRPYFEPTQPTVLAYQKPYVYLFHELVHFLHNEEGSFKADMNEEYRSVGLYEFENEPISENSLRKEAGLPRRPCYTWEPNGKNVKKYELEKNMRTLRRLPEQNKVGPSSPECKFR